MVKSSTVLPSIALNRFNNPEARERQGKESVEVWKKYFESIFNDGGSLEGQDEVESDKANDENDLMSE